MVENNFCYQTWVKEYFTAFSMKTTDYKDLVKVYQIVPLMLEHFEN